MEQKKDNANAPDNYECTPIHWAATIVKILAPLSDNPNAPNIHGQTPIIVAKNEEIRGIIVIYSKALWWNP